MKIQTEEGGDGDGRVETYYTITSIPLWISWGGGHVNFYMLP